MAEAPFWTKYGYYFFMGAIVLGQVAFRIYTQRCVHPVHLGCCRQRIARLLRIYRRAPAVAAQRRESQRASVRARIERAAAAASAAVAAGNGTAGAATAALSAGSEDEEGEADESSGNGGVEEHNTVAVPPSDAAAKKAE